VVERHSAPVAWLRSTTVTPSSGFNHPHLRRLRKTHRRHAHEEYGYRQRLHPPAL
jgi:hypothetical protein